jgi:glycosyltransferase involved in cell wall biosynthesis
LRDILLDTYLESVAKICVISPALLPNIETADDLEPALRERIRGKFVVTFIGRFSAEKSPQFFLELALRLALKPDYFFFFVGDGPLRSSVLSGARELAQRLHAPGSVTNPGAWIRRSSVIVVPSMLEGMPGVILESLAAGRAVVASRIGAIPEVIRHGFNGFLCDRGDRDQFLQWIEQLRTDDRLREFIEANAKGSARDGFGFERMLASYRAILAPDPEPRRN